MSFAKERNSNKKINYEILYPLHEIDSFNGAELKRHISSIADEVDAIIIDFSKVAYLNSSGLRELIQIFKVLRKIEKPLRLTRLSSDAKKIFMHTNLDRLFIFYDTLDEALEDLNGDK